MEKDQWQEKGKGHRQRMRQRFLEGGIDRFTDRDIVEFLLTLGTPRGDLKDPAREALKRFETLSGVLSAPLERLTEIKGIGQKNALYLKLVHEVAARYLKDRARDRAAFGSSREVYEYLLHSMRDLKREVFKVLLLNRKNQLIRDKDVFKGTVSASAVYPREVVTFALEHNAAGIICVHNHPSGDPAPSVQDMRLTRDLVWGSRLLMIPILDHIIIGHNTFYSFADQGRIRQYEQEYDAHMENLRVAGLDT